MVWGLAACSSGGGDNGGGGAASNTGPVIDYAGTVGAEGGVIEAHRGRVKLEFSPGPPTCEIPAPTYPDDPGGDIDTGFGNDAVVLLDFGGDEAGGRLRSTVRVASWWRATPVT